MEIRVSGILRKYVDYRKNLDYDTPTIRTGIEQLCHDHPQLTVILFDSSGAISGYHRIFLNGDQINTGDLDRPVTTSDTVDILTTIAGG